MLLTITTTHRPATDLGYLLAKNPARLHTFSIAQGHAHVFYPEATDERCTAALLLEIDPIALSRADGPDDNRATLEPYVNDRPYAASSFLSVAIANVYSSAMQGRSKDRQALADTEIPLELRIPSLRCRGGEAFARALFEPLGYAIDFAIAPLDARFPQWGDSAHASIT